MPRSLRWTGVVAALLIATAGRRAAAQAPDGADRLSAGAVADSLRVLYDLVGAVNRGRNDAATWYRVGMLSWVLWERSRHQPPAKGLDWTLLAPRADSSLRRALDMEPDNPAYFASLANFLLGSGLSFRLYGPYGVFNEQLERARESGDHARIAATAMDASRMYWLRYDNLVCEKLRDPHYSMLPAPDVEGVPSRVAAPGEPRPTNTRYLAELDYLKAELLSQEAYDAAPDNPVAFRRYAMLLADQMRWSALSGFAQTHIRHTPTDAFAWLVLGLARHKLGSPILAAAAFDTALARMEPGERHRLDRIERVLDPREVMRLAGASDTGRKITEAVYWRNADPLWSVPGTEPRAEFLARVAFAELRWTQEEISLNGVNTDYGNPYVRTGRRPVGTTVGCKQQLQAWYVMNDTTVLGGPAANWTRLARMRVDSIPVQVARFRATRDSTEVVVATLPPVASVARAAQVVGPVRTDFWVLANGLTEVIRDSVRPSKPGPQMFVHHLAPGGYVYRTEVSAEGSTVAARATAGFFAGDDARTGFSTSGTGMSDILLATRVTPRRTPALRWSDFDVTPALGPLVANTQIALLWEAYELGNDNGAARYAVDVAIQREVTPTSRAGRVAASIVGRAGVTVGVKRTNDRVEFSFERVLPHSATLPDNIAVSLGNSPPGTYAITLRITDRVGGATLGRTQRFTILAVPPKPVLYGR